MTNGIRGRIFTWLLVAIVPVLTVAFVSTSMVESRLAEQVVSDLGNVRRLEANRIDQELARYARDADRVARSSYQQIFNAVPNGNDVPETSLPLNAVARAIEDAAFGAGTSVVQARVVGLDGLAIAESNGFDSEPDTAGLVDRVLRGEPVRFGMAHRQAPGEDRIELVTAIKDPLGEIVGVLVTEADLAPIIDLLIAHESFGETSEAYLTQRDGDGRVTYISQLRFDRDAAFSAQRHVASDPADPVHQSLNAPDGKVLQGPDYMGRDSVFSVETIEATGWGLAIKVNADEAFGISASIRTLVLLGSLLAIAAMIIGWALVLRPLARRILTTAMAAERVAAGDYTSRLGDRSEDEIGEVGRAIDRLAADLEFDIRMRTDAERRLRYQATHDELTNIYNRQHMTSLIRTSLESSEDQSVTLFFLDLDDFKLVNDLWGHAVGDEVLSAVANRLRRLVGEDVLISRWGGDEFTVVLKNADGATINTLAHRVRSLFSQPINTSVGPHPMACSVGVATAVSGDDLDRLLHSADEKMFQEKQANRKARRIDPDTARLVETALAEGRLEVFYQPIVSMQSASETRIESVEALVRIRAGDGKLHQPADFLPNVLSHRYAREIDRSMATMALRDLADWRVQGLVPSTFTVALNLSPASMRDPSLAQFMRDIAAQCQVEPSAVVLELSEESDDLDPVVAAELRDAGFWLAVDDLGLKRSNLDRVVNGGVHIAKIDRRWLDDLVVLGALIHTCMEKNVIVIGEGVETMAQLDRLYEHGVRLCQGYLIARPQPNSSITELLSSGQRRPAAV